MTCPRSFPVVDPGPLWIHSEERLPSLSPSGCHSLSTNLRPVLLTWATPGETASTSPVTWNLRGVTRTTNRTPCHWSSSLCPDHPSLPWTYTGRDSELTVPGNTVQEGRGRDGPGARTLASLGGRGGVKEGPGVEGVRSPRLTSGRTQDVVIGSLDSPPSLLP